MLFAPAAITTNDRFGSSMGIDGDYLAVGAWLSDPEQTVDAGAVYLYELGADGDWVERQKIIASTPQVGAGFGFSVDLDGDILVVGAYDEAVDLDGDLNGDVDGDASGDAAGTVLGAGAVYVFERQADDRWEETARLTADEPRTEDFFGHNLEADAASQSVVIGVPGHDLAFPEVREVIEDVGSAYVFVRDESGQWVREAVLIDPNARAGDRAGNDVAISGDRVVVGHHLDDRSAGGNLSNAGGALVYSRFRSDDGVSWGGPVELDGSDARQRDRAGVGVDIDGNVVVMTGWAQQPGDRAVAWIFERDGTEWIEQARIEPDPTSVDGGHFGRHVELSGSLLAIGASLDDRAAIDGGAVHYYARSGDRWVAQAVVTPVAVPENAQAGIALAASAEWVGIGAERVGLGAVNSGGACVVPLAEIVDVSVLDRPAKPDPVLASEGVPAPPKSEDRGRGPGSLIPRRLASTRGVAVIGGAAVAGAALVGAGVLIARRRP